MSRINRIINNPGKHLSPKHIINNVIGGRMFLLWRNLSPLIFSDRFFLRVYFRLAMHEKLDLDNPQTFTQKIQWLKLHNTNPAYSRMVDKYQVRKIITKELGEEYLIPLLGVWNKFEDIDLERLPNQFVLKTTHDSGSVIICKDKSIFNINSARKKLSKALKRNYFYYSREYPYKNAIPRILAEKYMYDNTQMELTDYKFFCFHGEPQILLLVSQNGAEKQNDYLDMDFKLLPFSTGFANSRHKLTKPDNFNEMISVAKILSRDIIHVRIDLYNVNGKIYFGEYTFHHGGGIIKFSPPDVNRKLGEMILLPIS